ncbi:hypothetical protein Tco_0598965 [Tanacetum coccineum]
MPNVMGGSIGIAIPRPSDMICFLPVTHYTLIKDLRVIMLNFERLEKARMDIAIRPAIDNLPLALDRRYVKWFPADDRLAQMISIVLLRSEMGIKKRDRGSSSVDILPDLSRKQRITIAPDNEVNTNSRHNDHLGMSAAVAIVMGRRQTRESRVLLMERIIDRECWLRGNLRITEKKKELHRVSNTERYISSRWILDKTFHERVNHPLFNGGGVWWGVNSMDGKEWKQVFGTCNSVLNRIKDGCMQPAIRGYRASIGGMGTYNRHSELVEQSACRGNAQEIQSSDGRSISHEVGNAAQDPKRLYPFLISTQCLGSSYEVELADGKIVSTNTVLRGCTLELLNHVFKIDLLPTRLGSFDVIVGMDWTSIAKRPDVDPKSLPLLCIQGIWVPSTGGNEEGNLDEASCLMLFRIASGAIKDVKALNTETFRSAQQPEIPDWNGEKITWI